MEKIKSLYYERFINHVVECYSAKLKAAKPGHCMKITGLAMKELQILLSMLRGINENLCVFILSETEKGEEYIHATKLIELRNSPDKAVLILVPSNSRTSAEDSYGDATFQNLPAIELQDSFLGKLVMEMPEEKQYIWKQVRELLSEIHSKKTTIINYILFLELEQFEDKAWGNGLFLFGLLPDKELVKDQGAMRRRFMLNMEKVSSVLGDFSLTAADRISMLPLEKNTVQKGLMAFMTKEQGIEDNITLFERIYDTHPEYNYANMPWLTSGDGGPVKITVDIVHGKEPLKELVREDDGNYVLNIPHEKKSKISFTITTDPSPKDNPDIVSFEIAIVDIDDFSEVGVIKKAQVTTNKRATRKLSVNIPNGMFDDGEYMLRVRALDGNGIVLDNKKVFKEERVQAAWMDAHEQNPNLQMEQFRLEKHVAYCNETAVFTIQNDPDDIYVDAKVDKRAKVNSFTQALIGYRAIHLSRGENLDVPSEGAERNKWEEGALNSTYQFDFGAAYAYQIQLSKKLIQLERTFLDNSDNFGHIDAYLSGNPTDAWLLNPHDTAQRSPKFVPTESQLFTEELLALRNDLLTLIKESAEGESGLTYTLDFTANLGIIKSYLSEYDQWLRDILETNLDEQKIIAIQNLDTVSLTVEMPDGGTTSMKLISPLHPLRLAWIVNLYELYQDWEGKTLDNPKYRKAWYRKLDKLFQGQLPLNIAPLVLCENSLKEAYQYIGELTFGWGAYAQPSLGKGEAFASGYRQLKAYAAMLLNVARERRIDSDVSRELVVRHLFNYGLSHH